MEEHFGALWNLLITGGADRRHPQAAVRLTEVAHAVGILFRALGGDGGLQIEPADATAQARRGLLQWLAGMGDKVEIAWRDERFLRLPTHCRIVLMRTVDAAPRALPPYLRRPSELPSRLPLLCASLTVLGRAAWAYMHR